MLLPPAGPGIRHDSGSYEGWTVPIDYDPLLAKLIGYGSDRKQAILRLQRALQEYFVGGIQTNISLFQRILADPDFQAARLDTGYLERLLAREHEHVLEGKSSAEERMSEVAAIAAGLFAVLDPAPSAPHTTSSISETTTKSASGWKQAALREALRS